MEASLNGPLGQTALGQGMLKIGRAPDNTLVISDPQASAHHAEVGPGFGANSYQITDLNSTNGTFVNEQRLTSNAPRPLNTGDVIRIGSLRFTYEASSGHAPTIAAGAINNDQTIADQAPAAAPTLYQQASAFSNPPQSAIPAPPPPPPPLPPVNYPPAVQGYPVPANFNQPSYPSAGGFGQVGYPQPKKSRLGMWIGLLVLLLLVVGGSIGGYVYVNRSTPEKTLQAFCSALQNNDAQGYYNTLSKEEQAKTDLNRISTGMQVAKLLLGGFTNCTSSNVLVNGDNATATLTLTPVRGKVVSGPVTLVYENGQWRLSSKTGLPGL